MRIFVTPRQIQTVRSWEDFSWIGLCDGGELRVAEDLLSILMMREAWNCPERFWPDYDDESQAALFVFMQDDGACLQVMSLLACGGITSTETPDLNTFMGGGE